MKLNPNCSEWISRIQFDVRDLTEEEQDALSEFIGSDGFNISVKEFNEIENDLVKLPFWNKIKDKYKGESEC